MKGPCCYPKTNNKTSPITEAKRSSKKAWKKSLRSLLQPEKCSAPNPAPRPSTYKTLLRTPNPSKSSSLQERLVGFWLTYGIKERPHREDKRVPLLKSGSRATNPESTTVLKFSSVLISLGYPKQNPRRSRSPPAWPGD